MPTFFEQFRDFLRPRFELLHQLGRGGMGTVYLARDTALRCYVAIKTLRDQDASAIADERFLREARILAELKHPHIVHINDVGDETAPFRYYIMDYLPGETLETRLTRTVLRPREAVRFGCELLAALGVAHSHGIIHRDVKPSNVFQVQGRCILTDFGVAKSPADSETPLTGPKGLVGTPPYMAPEQTKGRVSPRSDLYSVGMVLYEALTKRRWARLEDPRKGDWAGVPFYLRPVLRRALAWSPEHRWPDAASFAAALSGARPRALRRWTAVGSIGLALVAIVINVLLGRRGPSVDVRIDRFHLDGTDVPREVAESLPELVAARLTGFQDFSVAGPGRRARGRVIATGTISRSSGSLRVLVRLGPGLPFTVWATVSQWHNAADLIADSVLVRVYRANALDSQLPVRAMPQTPEGLRVFLDAEKAFARAWWDSAYTAYGVAEAVDSTCVLCAWRRAEVGNFLSLPEDSADQAVYRGHLAQFPANYQALIRAETVPLRTRLDSFDAVKARWPSFLLGEFRAGDERLHRGPFVGRSRRESAEPFTQASTIRRDFAPAWEHLLWLRVAEGDSTEATNALAALRPLSPPGNRSTAIRDLLQGAFAWRFLPPAMAARLTDSIAGPAGRRQEALDAGARYLDAFGDAQGAVWLGARLDSANDHRESAMLAQVFGYLALGQPQRSRQVLARLHGQFGDEAVDLFALELDAMLLMFDPDSATPAHWAGLAERLREVARGPYAALRPRADWMAAMLTQRLGRGAQPVRGMPATLAALYAASDLAQRGADDSALARSESLLELESPRVEDPFFRTALHLLRAEWQERRARARLADLELLWYENTDVIGLPQGDPQPSEVDWAFGTLARWRRMRLAGAEAGDLCRIDGDLVRLWADGEPRYAARADSARRDAVARGCGGR